MSWIFPVGGGGSGGVTSLNGRTGVLTVTSTGSSVTVTSTASTVNVEINGAHSNTFSVTQNFQGINASSVNSPILTSSISGNTDADTWLSYDNAGNVVLGDAFGAYNAMRIVINQTNGIIIFINGQTLTTNNVTLDDGSGNASGFGTITMTQARVASVATTAAAATTVTVTASPFTFTNNTGRNIQLFIEGGTVSAITFLPNGSGGIALNAFTDNIMTLRGSDAVTVTYTGAPTMKYIGL